MPSKRSLKASASRRIIPTYDDRISGSRATFMLQKQYVHWLGQKGQWTYRPRSEGALPSLIRRTVRLHAPRMASRETRRK